VREHKDMPAKKTAKRKPTGPVRISGKDASLISFVARYGAPSDEDRKKFEKLLSPHVEVVFLKSTGQKKNAGQKTLTEIRRVAKSNTVKATLGSTAAHRNRAAFSRLQRSFRSE